MSEAAAPRREDLPDGSVRIIFAAPILFHAEPKGHCHFRPPTVGELIDLGDPRSLVVGGDNMATEYIDRTILRQWAAKLIEGHDFDFIARERDLRLGVLIERALLGFFENARTWLKAGSALSHNGDTPSPPSKV